MKPSEYLMKQVNTWKAEQKDWIQQQFHLYNEDCIAVANRLEPNSVDTIITDPPYGLSSGSKSVADRIREVFVEIGLPQLYQYDIEHREHREFSSVPLCCTTLRGVNGTVRIRPGVSMPEGTVDLNNSTVGKQKVNQSSEAACNGVSDDNLSSECDFLPQHFLGDFILQLGDLPNTRPSYLRSGDTPEAFFGGFAVPICPVLAAGSPSFESDSSAIIFSDHNVGVSDDSQSKSKGSPCILTLAGTVNTLMLRFDLRGRPTELRATYRAYENDPLANRLGSQLVRTCSATSRLAAVAEPNRVSFVVTTADGTNAVYWFHLWMPPCEKIHRIIPPGGFMGKGWDAVLPDPEIWTQLLRVAKPGAFLLAFGGSRTSHRLVCAIEDAGWEIRDGMIWLFGSGFPKSLSISKALDKAAGAEREVVGTYASPENTTGWKGQASRSKYSGPSQHEDGAVRDITAPATDAAKEWDGWGTALSPSHEPICVAMKPLDGTFAANAMKHSVAGLNIDGARIGTEKRVVCQVVPNMRRVDRGKDGKTNDGRQGANWEKYKNETGKSERTYTGRWPKNVILSDDDCVAELFPYSKDGVANPNKQGKGWHNQGIGGGTHSGYGGSGSASRYFYTAKASKRERGEGNNHPTVKPLKLMEYLCKLTMTPTGGIVFDPFMGSGTTGVACANIGRQFIGCENDTEHGYFKIAEKKIREAYNAR